MKLVGKKGVSFGGAVKKFKNGDDRDAFVKKRFLFEMTKGKLNKKLNGGGS